MYNLAEKVIVSRVEERLKRKPFSVDKAKVTELNGEFAEVASYFDITTSEDKSRLWKAHSYLTRRVRDLSLELSDAPKGERRNIGFVPIGSDELVIVLKVERIDEKERLESYGIDTYFLHMIRLTVLDVLRSYLSKPCARAGLLQVTGWIDRVIGDQVRFRYCDEVGDLVFAEVPRQRFEKISNIREDSEFLIQTWEEGDKAMCDFLPITAASEAFLTSGITSILKLAGQAFHGTGLERTDEPPPPNNWSDQTEVDTYIRKLKKKYKGIDWRGGGQER